MLYYTVICSTFVLSVEKSYDVSSVWVFLHSPRLEPFYGHYTDTGQPVLAGSSS